uniref:Uncharacterized protein n=1 Tax=Ciona intestinalis TaxID=7719 RepID=H2Y1T0_CIOIN
MFHMIIVGSVSHDSWRISRKALTNFTRFLPFIFQLLTRGFPS